MTDIDDIKDRIRRQQEYTKPERQRVVSAANRWPDGTIIMGVRHYCMQMRLHMHLMGYEHGAGVEQGFIDNYNNFLTRKEAYKIADNMGQIRNEGACVIGTLYSEDLY